MKTKRNWKWKITHIDLERRTLFFSSCKNRQLKVKLWWVGVGKRKKSLCFAPFLLSEEILFKCIVYWRHVQNIHAFTHPQILLDTLFYLFLKSSKAFSVSLNHSLNVGLININLIFTKCAGLICSFQSQK